MMFSCSSTLAILGAVNWTQEHLDIIMISFSAMMIDLLINHVINER